jgi:rubrerythrin
LIAPGLLPVAELSDSMNLGFITHLSEYTQTKKSQQVQKLSNQKSVAKQLSCLGILEKYTALIYSKVADLFHQPLVKSLFLSISQDSTKHSTLLKGLAKSLSGSKVKVNDCAESVGQVYSLVGNCVNELTRNRKEELEFSQLVQMLSGLEKSFVEEYSILLQSGALRLIVKAISRSCNVNLENVKDVFEGILKDEAHHADLLKTIKGMIPENSIQPEPILRKEKPAEESSTPEVKYKNPDAWICALPPTTYDSNH